MNPKLPRIVVFALIVFSFVLSACGVSHKHDKLVGLYQGAQKAKSNANACFAMNGGMVRDSFKVFNAWLDTDSKEVQLWKEGQVAAANAKLAAAQAASKETGGDLGAAAAEGGTPADIAAGFALQISAYAEAPWNHLPPEVALSMNATISEAYHTTYGCVTDWNSAVFAYNDERARIGGLVDSGRVVGDAATALGLTELPSSLPYYEPPADSAPIGTDFLAEPTPSE